MRRFGTKGEGKAIFAVAHTLVVIIWHVLKEASTYQELGADYFARRTDTRGLAAPPVARPDLEADDETESVRAHCRTWAAVRSCPWAGIGVSALRQEVN